MASMKTKLLAGAAAVLLLSGASVATWKVSHPPPVQTVIINPSKPAVHNVADDGWLERFNAVYGLKEGEIIKPILPPLIPERQAFWDAECRRNNGGKSWKLGQWEHFTMEWDGSAAHWTSIGGQGSLDSAVRFCVGLKPYQIDKSIPSGLQFGGDWIVRKGTTTEKRMDALGKIVSAKLGRSIRFEKRKVPGEALAVSGTYTGKGVLILSNTGKPPVPAPPSPAYNTQLTLDNLLDNVADQLHRRIEKHVPRTNVMVSYRDFGYDPDHIDAVLSSLAEQTGLKFERHPEDQDVWFMVDEKGQP